VAAGNAGRAWAEMSLRTQELAEPAAVPFRSLFLLRTFWITLAIGTTVNLSWHFYRVWLPRHWWWILRFTDRELQYLLIAFYLAADVGSIVIGFNSRGDCVRAIPSSGERGKSSS